MRDRRPTRFARQLTDQASVHSADEPCVIRSRAARGNSRGEKAVGEAVSFPYRLITNHRLDFATIYGRGGGVGRGLGDGIGLGVGFGVCVAVAVAVGVAVAVAVAVGVALGEAVGVGVGLTPPGRG